MNGKEVNNEQPVKVSRIEVIENKLPTNTTQSPETKPPITKLLEQKLTEPQTVQQTEATPATPSTPTQKDSEKIKEEKEDDDDAESSIVTADYIQQSELMIIETI